MKSKFFVPFETAQRLKEKGYPQESDYMYCGEERHWRHLTLYQMNKINAVAAPTYHEVLDWLYGKKICITCHVAYSYEEQYNGFRYEIQSYNEDDYPDDIYRTREETLNAAILKALEML